MLSFRLNGGLIKARNQELDIQEVYDKVQFIHDFVGGELSNVGDLNQVEQNLNNQYAKNGNEFYLLELDEVKLKINSFRIGEDRNIGVTLVYLGSDEFVNFLREYFDSSFSGKVKIAPDLNFNLVDVEEFIKEFFVIRKEYKKFDNRREYEIKKYITFEKMDNVHVVRKLNMKRGMFSKMNEKASSERIKLILKYLKKSFEEEYNKEKKKYTYNSLDSENQEKYYSFQEGLLGSGLCTDIFLYFYGMKVEEADQVSEKVFKELEKIESLLAERKKVAKLVKPVKKSLFDNLERREIVEPWEMKIALKKYKELEAKGECFYAPVVVNLARNILEDLEKNNSLYESVAVKYTRILKAISEENLEDFILYYKTKIFHMVELSGQELEDELDKIVKGLYGIPYEYWKDVFMKGDFPHNLTDEQLLKFLDVIKSQGLYIAREKKLFLETIYSRMLNFDYGNGMDDVYRNVTAFELVSTRYSQLRDQRLESVDIFGRFTSLLVKFLARDLSANYEVLKDGLKVYLEDMGFEPYLDIDLFIEYGGKGLYKLLFQDIFKSSMKLGIVDKLKFSSFGISGALEFEPFMNEFFIPYVVYCLHNLEEHEHRMHSLNFIENGDFKYVFMHLIQNEELEKIINVLDKEELKPYCQKILDFWAHVKFHKNIGDYSRKGLEKLVAPNRASEAARRIVHGMASKNVKFEEGGVKGEEEGRKISIEFSLGKLPDEEYKKKEKKEREKIEQMMLFHNGPVDEQMALDFLEKYDKYGVSVGCLLAVHPSVAVKKKLVSTRGFGKTETEAMFENPDLEEEVILEFLEQKEKYDTYIGMKIARHPSLVIRMKLLESKEVTGTEKLVMFEKEDIEEELVLKFLELNDSYDTAIGMKIAQHPSKKVLLKLLESKGFQKEEKFALFEKSDLDEDIVLRFLEFNDNYDTLIGLKLVEHKSEKVLKKLIESSGFQKEEKFALFERTDLTDEIILHFMEKFTTFSDYIGIKIAKNPSLEVRKKLVSLSGLTRSEAYAIFENPDIEEELILHFLEHHNAFPDKIGVMIARHPSLEVRKQFVKFGGKLTDLEILAIFENIDLEDEIIELFLENINSTSDYVGMILAQHPSKVIRKWLASHGGLTENEALALFAGEELEEDIALIFIENQKKIHKDIVGKLFNHSSQKVRDEINKRITIR